MSMELTCARMRSRGRRERSERERGKPMAIEGFPILGDLWGGEEILLDSLTCTLYILGEGNDGQAVMETINE